MNERINKIKNFLEIPYDKLEKLNIKASKNSLAKEKTILEKEYRAFLKKEKKIKAITLCFSDLEGRFHTLDYDKQFLLDSSANFTFDGSSVRGFSKQHESDLRLEVDWPSFRYLPVDVFGPGKVAMFGYVLNRDRSPYLSDLRGQLKHYCDELKRKRNVIAYLSAEVEGFLVNGLNAEQNFQENRGFKFISSSGYYHSLPLDKLKIFIDRVAEAERAMGFLNEKDHPEVAPAQFELNFSYSEILRACDNIQLYKLICRQIANSMEMTATFLPKPMSKISGNGMHLNISLSKSNRNIFYHKNGKNSLSVLAWTSISKILNHAPELCLLFNSSVNSYRRLDPKFEAPNQIKISSIDRGAMIRIPEGNERSTRLEIRSVAPDANPYLAALGLLKTIFEGEPLSKEKNKRERLRYLPGTISDAIKIFKTSEFMEKILTQEVKRKYLLYKQIVADRNPKELGTRVKTAEVIYHHEVTNQMLWNMF